MSKITFKDVVVDAYIGTLKISAREINRDRPGAFAKHRGPGMPGSYLQPNGRESIVDTVTALMTLTDVKKLEAIEDKTKPQTWIHPLLKGFEAYVTAISEPISSDMDGYLLVTFQVEEHYDPNTTILPSMTLTANGARKKSQSSWSDLSTAVGDLPDWDGTGASTQSAATFDDAWSNLGDGWDALDSVYEDYENGDSTWRDLSRSLNVFEDLSDTFVDAAHGVAGFIGETAEMIQRIPSQIVETGKDALDAITETAENVVTFTVDSVTDLPTIMQEAFGSIEDMESVMDSNGIIDPFMLLPGTVISVPRASAD